MKTEVSNHWELSSSYQCRKFLICVAPMPGDQPSGQQANDFLPQGWVQLLSEYRMDESTGNWRPEPVRQTYTQFNWDEIKTHNQTIDRCEPKNLTELFGRVDSFITKDPVAGEAEWKFLFADLSSLAFSDLGHDRAAPAAPAPEILAKPHSSSVCTLLATLKARLGKVHDCAFIVLLKFANTETVWPTLLLGGDLDLHPLFATATPQPEATPGHELQIPSLLPVCVAAHQVSRGFHIPDLGALGFSIGRLARVIGCLRGPNGCPWDTAQNTTSLVPFMIEEAYEATEAAQLWVSGQDPNGTQFADELGDVLLQILLHAQIAAEQKFFDLKTVIDGLTEKMIRRHPHVFASPLAQSANLVADIKDAASVTKLWEQVKATETKAHPNADSSLLKKATKKRALPTLAYVTEISKRASKLGFCWPTLKDVWQDVENELLELKNEVFVDLQNWQQVEDELGDVIFALANVVVHMNQQMAGPEELSFDIAARKAAAKFVTRFKEMESIYAENTQQTLTEALAQEIDLDTWNRLWSDAKKRRYR